MLQIRCKNNNVTKSFPEGCSLLDVYQEFADDIKLPYPVISAKVNNASQGLKFRLYQNRDVSTKVLYFLQSFNPLASLCIFPHCSKG